MSSGWQKELDALNSEAKNLKNKITAYNQVIADLQDMKGKLGEVKTGFTSANDAFLNGAYSPGIKSSDQKDMTYMGTTVDEIITEIENILNDGSVQDALETLNTKYRIVLGNISIVESEIARETG